MTKKRVFRYCYYTQENKPDRGVRLHQLRDGDAFSELSG